MGLQEAMGTRVGKMAAPTGKKASRRYGRLKMADDSAELVAICGFLSKAGWFELLLGRGLSRGKKYFLRIPDAF